MNSKSSMWYSLARRIVEEEKMRDEVQCSCQTSFSYRLMKIQVLASTKREKIGQEGKCSRNMNPSYKWCCLLYTTVGFFLLETFTTCNRYLRRGEERSMCLGIQSELLKCELLRSFQ
jgi:hypothetical protein